MLVFFPRLLMLYGVKASWLFFFFFKCLGGGVVIHDFVVKFPTLDIQLHTVVLVLWLLVSLMSCIVINEAY